MSESKIRQSKLLPFAAQRRHGNFPSHLDFLFLQFSQALAHRSRGFLVFFFLGMVQASTA
jgi:hypothetical protein